MFEIFDTEEYRDLKYRSANIHRGNLCTTAHQ